MIDNSHKENLVMKINDMNKNNRLCKELVLLVVPRNSEVTSCNLKNFKSQASSVSAALHKICYRSVIRDEGWRRMPCVVEIMDLIGII